MATLEHNSAMEERNAARQKASGLRNRSRKNESSARRSIPG